MTRLWVRRPNRCPDPVLYTAAGTAFATWVAVALVVLPTLTR